MPKNNPLRALAGALTATVTAIAISACSPAGENPAPAASEETTEASVVATTKVWADVASEVLGTEVEAVIANSSTDPHDYEPTATDRAKIASASLLIANGGGYDAALYQDVDPSKIISSLPLTGVHAHDDAGDHDHDNAGDHDHDDDGDHDHDNDGDHDHDDDGDHDHDDANRAEGDDTHDGDHDDAGDHDHDDAKRDEGDDDNDDDRDHGENEHTWYSTVNVAKMGAKIAEKTGKNTDSLDARLMTIKQKIDALPAARIAQVHPIADALLEESTLKLVTPQSYRSAALNHTEPSSAAVAEFIDAIKAGDIDVVISNPQSPNGSAQRIVDAAEEADVPVVEVHETPPNGENFFNYFEKVVDNIAKAAA
ncbi:metal ABC transporter solute-binding protein, Zn/Mn family [Corynebacterium mayonis]|uniref:metal ABC transporter solute-binding protein, Zn/Mn family n=1 Tax=Corynebacterium mayonis TaxID=3062461 RepID=UPI00313FFF72